jgi:hypothetical protein
MTASDRVEVWRSCCRPSVAVAAPFVWDASLVRPSLVQIGPDRSVSAWTFSTMRLMLCTIVPGRFSVSVPNPVDCNAEFAAAILRHTLVVAAQDLDADTPSAARLRHDLEPAHPAPQVVMP